MDDITVKQFITHPNAFQYDLLLKNLKPKNVLKFDENSITYENVRKIFTLIQKGDCFEDICNMFVLAFGINKETFYNLPIKKYYQARNFLIDFRERSLKKENDLLKSENTDGNLWKQAGGDSLNAFSDLLPLVQLGEIYNIYPLDLYKKPYKEIILLLVLHKRKNEVQENYIKLKK